ncbi:hypothetical protein N431DRAFT_460923 [Stipitochalara longipes BDJ]|nr:hypothetical protein N431DRAFT_460923 [Stipitochalara longipes BDJ]
MNRARERHQNLAETSTEISTSNPFSQVAAERSSGLMMLNLLRARRGLGVIDPKDMIFAHIGFASDGPDLGRLVNYSMSCAETYYFFARYMIDNGWHVQLFSELDDVDNSSRLNGLSSWVPDWSITDKSSRFQPVDKFLWDFFVASQNDPGFPRETMNYTWCTFAHEPPVLACFGIEVDIVLHCSGALSKVIELYRQHPNIVLWYEKVQTFKGECSFDIFEKASAC